MSLVALRRLVHAATGLLPVLLLVTEVGVFRGLVVAAAVLALAVDLARLSYGEAGVWLARTFPLFREHEARRLSGASWLWVGYAAAVWMPVPAAVAGIVVAAVADPAASLVGERVGAAGRKTWAGSCTAFGVALAALLLLRLDWPVALIAATAGAAVERWPGPLDDNLLLAPVVAGTVALLA